MYFLALVLDLDIALVQHLVGPDVAQVLRLFLGPDVALVLRLVLGPDVALMHRFVSLIESLAVGILYDVRA